MENITKPSFRLIGIKLPKKTTNTDGQSDTDCGNLWTRFEEENILSRIPDKLSEDLHAVYFDYSGEDKENFSYFIGCRVDSETSAPEGLYCLDIPSQEYHQVTARGEIPECISDAWRAIFGSDLNRAYSFDYELYDKRSKDWNNGEIDIFISVKG